MSSGLYHLGFWRVLGTALLLYLITAIISGVMSGIADSVLLLGTGEVGRLLVGALGGVVSIVVQPESPRSCPAPDRTAMDGAGPWERWHP